MERLPEQYARATGVEEKVRQCMESGCHKYFRSANAHETTCPVCGSEKTRDINDGKQAGSIRPSLVE